MKKRPFVKKESPEINQGFFILYSHRDTTFILYDAGQLSLLPVFPSSCP
jgi:hypothetical protein